MKDERRIMYVLRYGHNTSYAVEVKAEWGAIVYNHRDIERAHLFTGEEVAEFLRKRDSSRSKVEVVAVRVTHTPRVTEIEP